ncbi:GNAT family N-acetyltransferase [Halobacillus litoralis]|uniref:GNAT family N-acetyltransferase n=1 Tax=Halobacillus litoralis TaxID=45668 RepID=UPI001CD7A968|nr:GNAT family protein [Halobacillus litoralis]MCA0971997.1 GNAT family N-acetyltransferase [Halobacillus litoralis]
MTPFTLKDARLIESWIDSETSLFQWAGPAFQYPLDTGQWTHYMETENQKLFSAKDKEDSQQIVGHIALGKIDKLHRQARIGKVIVHPDYRGKGIAEHMIRSVLHVAFQELDLHKVTLGVFDFNTPAIRCYERIGFQQDGLLRDHRRIGNEYWNLVEMSLLETD